MKSNKYVSLQVAFPQDLLGQNSLNMAMMPGGDELVVLRSGTTVRMSLLVT